MPSLLLQTGRVIRVTLNRPDVRNAFDEGLIEELTEWARTPPAAEARVAVLGGAGRVFCAGADLAWMSKTVDYSRDENARDAMRMGAMFEALDSYPLPLVARVHGAALGGGAGLVAVCDIAVAAESTLFGFTEAKLGILPAVIAPFAIARIGVSAARELFLTASRFPAARAREIGLVAAVAPDDALDAAVEGYVNELMTSGPEAVAAAKRLIRRVAGADPRDVATLTADTIAAHRTSAEGQAGMRAFLEKRRAPWIDKE